MSYIVVPGYIPLSRVPIMARLTKVLTLINDVCGPISIPDEETHYATVFIAAAAVGTVVLEQSGQDDGAASPVDDWQAVDLTLPLAAGIAHAASLVGTANVQSGYALVPGARKVRIRKSVAGPGDARVTLAISCL